MAGQGDTTNAIAAILQDAGWTVVFKCIPNSTHVGVVPIPITQGGAAKQRYPDVLSFRDDDLRLTEVEIAISEEVVEKTIERFSEQMLALSIPETWSAWRARIAGLTGHQIPAVCTIRCELVLCKPIKDIQVPLLAKLNAHLIPAYTIATYVP
jgi:hypothetical protein